MLSPPSGTVTFLFTDIEGSTRLWEERPGEMRSALAEHDAIVRGAVEAHGGYVFSTGGDGFAAAFSRAADAVDAAAKAQAGLAEHPLIRVRMGIHTGEVQERDGDYFGPAVNRAARIMAAGHGGQVVVSAATAQLLAGVDMRELGAHRLRDLAAPVELWQLGSDSYPPLRTLESIRHNLPIQLTSLVGRESDVDEVRALLAANRLVTLTGVGGVGKTRLALQVAADMVAERPDGVFLVEFAPVRDADEVASVVATAMGIDLRSGDAVAQIREVVGKRLVLIVLDNCEHLIDGVATVAAALMSHCPALRMLATSREPLGVAGEVTERVRSLSVGEAGFGTAEQLFMLRSLASLPEFAPDAAARGVITSICQRLDGIPLAIELAAARVRTMSVADISSRLDRRFRLLTGGSRTALERHQTLRAAVDWSYGLLSAEQKIVLDRVSVFAGGFDLDAAEVIVGVEPIDSLDVLDHLVALCDRSLLNADTTGGPTRYRLLETIRQFAREKLVERDEADEIAAAQAAYYVERLSRFRPRRFEAVLADVVAFETDIDNLRAAFDHLAETGDAAQVVAAGVVLSDLWLIRSIGQEQQRLHQILTFAEALDRAARAEALSAIAYPLFLGGATELGVETARRALAVDDPGARLDPDVYLVVGQVEAGTDLEQGLAYFAKAEALGREQGNWYAVMNALAMNAGYCGHVGRVEEFEHCAAELKGLLRSAGSYSSSNGKFGLAAGSVFVAPEAVFDLLGDDEIDVSFGTIAAGWGQIFRGRAAAVLDRHQQALQYFARAADIALASGIWMQGLMVLRWGAASLAVAGATDVAIELDAAADASSHWQYDELTYQPAARRMQQLTAIAPPELVASSRALGSALSISEALTLFIATCRRVSAADPYE